jgi:enoyl-CoA hydratase/carnithine racemase
MSEAPRVVTTVHEHVAEVRLNRPDKRNGLDMAMFEALIAAGEKVAADKSVRAVVLSGEGKAFSAGLDWPSFMAAGDKGQELLLARNDDKSPANVAQRAAFVWVECPVPVIAALHGAVFGGGFQIALGADLRIASPDAELSVMEIKYGLIPDMGASKTLFPLVRPDVAKELIFTGRIVRADEALLLGLVTRVDADPRARAHEMARTIAAKSPHAIVMGKRLVDRAPLLSAREALLLETELQLSLLGSKNQIEAALAAMAKREAAFVDRD